MAKQTTNLLKAPIFSDPRKNSAARLLHSISWILMLSGAAGLLALALPAMRQAVYLGIFGYLLALGLGTQVLLRFQQVDLASGVLLALSWLGSSLLLYRSGGLASPFTTLYLLIIAAAGMLINLRAAALTTALSILATLGITFASRNGALTPVSYPLWGLWAVYGLLFITGFILLAQYIRYQQQTVANALENQRKLTQHNYELQEQQDTLARRISERTGEVSQYLLYMQTATETSQLIAAYTSRERIMQEFVDLLQMRFGLYYTGLFLIDRSGQWAVLQAGTGETGRAMLARHHKIEIGSGMIGWSVANARPRVAGDVSADAIRLPTSELPNTRSEAAIPMRALGRVIGALTVQSTRPNSFDHELVTVLQNYADMVAATLENIRMEEENQAVRKQEQSRQRAEDRASWRVNLGRRGVKNVIYDRISVAPVSGETNPAVTRVQQTGVAMTAEQNGSPTAFIPVHARNQTVGVLTFRKPAGEPAWTDTEVKLLDQLTGQLGDALDNARLYQSIQRQAAQEQLVSSVGSRLRETLDVDTVLRSAADEIFRSLQLEQVAIELVEDRPSPAA